MIREAAAGALAVALTSLGFAPASAAAAGDDAYATLAKSYFAASFARDPGNATGSGVHDYDDLLGIYTSASVKKRLADDDDFLRRLASIDPSTLSPEVALDAKLLGNALHDDELIWGEERDWQRQPDYYVATAAGAVYGVIERAYAPAPVRIRHAIARELAVGAFLRDAEANLTSVDPTAGRLGYDDARGTADFFTQTVPSAFGTIADPSLRRQLAAAGQKARAAMLSFAAWIKRGPLAHPSGTFAIGPKIYAERLKYEEALDMPLDAYRKVGEDALAATRAQFVSVAKTIDPHVSPRAAYAELGAHHPTAATLLPTALRDLAALRAFVVSHHIITLPADANITVVPTPVFARATTFASMDAPGPLEQVAQGAYFNVTPVDPALPPAQREEFLRYYNDSYLPLLAAHEVYPGHYTNYTIAKHLPLSLTRRLLAASSFAEGWAHYDEQMMVDEGFGGGPRMRLAQLELALIRECRFLVGLREHTEGMTVAAGTDFFVNNAFMARETATKEALRGTNDPTYGYYMLGRLEILKLRSDMQKKLGADFTLQKFHDALLAHGDPPIPLLRPLLLGDADDGKVL